MPRVLLSEHDLRLRFNNGRYAELVAYGVLREQVIRNGHPAPERSGQPFCTRSQMIDYVDANNQVVAKVHQYVRPDGTLGGSGRPDPKALREEGTFYIRDPGDGGGDDE
jgi:hypothetical protein